MLMAFKDVCNTRAIERTLSHDHTMRQSNLVGVQSENKFFWTTLLMKDIYSEMLIFAHFGGILSTHPLNLNRKKKRRKVLPGTNHSWFGLSFYLNKKLPKTDC